MPFAVQSVAGYYGSAVAIRFVLLLCDIGLVQPLMASFLKRRLGSGFLSFIVVIVILVLWGNFEYFRILSFRRFQNCFRLYTEHTFGLLFAIGRCGGVFTESSLFLLRIFTAKKIQRKNKTENNFRSNLSFLNRFGVIGEIIALEIKLDITAV